MRPSAASPDLTGDDIHGYSASELSRLSRMQLLLNAEQLRAIGRAAARWKE